MTRRALTAAAVLLSLGTLYAQSAPLPDPAAFLAGVRAHLHTDRTLQSQYVYRERKRDVSLNMFGKLSVGGVKVTEIHPGLDPDDTYRRVIEVDDKPRDPRELEQEDLKYQQKILDAVRKREHETDADRRKRQQSEEQKRREEEATFDDVFRIYRMTLVGREVRDNHPVIVVDFEPKPEVAPRTDDGKRLKKIKGRAWISESDFEVARVEFEVLDDISIGMVFAKMYKGSKVSLERRKVNDEVWLPAEARFDGSGRVLVRKFHVEQVVEFSDYKKFTVGSDETFRVRK